MNMTKIYELLQPNFPHNTIYKSVNDVLDSIETIGESNVMRRIYEPLSFSTYPNCTESLECNKRSRIITPEKQILLNDDIKNMNLRLAENQIVFHAGTTLLPDIIEQPLSTSLCPTIAYSNAGYDCRTLREGRLIFYCLTVIRSPLVFVYELEKEVLFSSNFIIGNKKLYRSAQVKQDGQENQGVPPYIDLQIYKGEIKEII